MHQKKQLEVKVEKFSEKGQGIAFENNTKIVGYKLIRSVKLKNLYTIKPSMETESYNINLYDNDNVLHYDLTTITGGAINNVSNKFPSYKSSPKKLTKSNLKKSNSIRKNKLSKRK